MKECMHKDCENPRRDVRGSGGLFCSDDCRLSYGRETTDYDETVGELTEAITGLVNNE